MLSRTEGDAALHAVHDRIARLQQFFGLINELASRLSRLEPDDLDELRELFAAD